MILLQQKTCSNAASHLKKNSKEDDGNSGGDKELLAANVGRKSECQGKRNCPAQATIDQAKLIFHIEGDGAERIDDLSEHQDTCGGKARTRRQAEFMNGGLLPELSSSANHLLLPRPLQTKAKSNVNKM